MFIYSRPVHVYETDLMGIVHHSNYLRFCEEVRLQWSKKYVDHTEDKSIEENIFALTVIETKVKHKLPLKYGDTFQIETQARVEGAVLTYQYKIKNNNLLCALVETSHCSVTKDLKPTRLSKKILNAVKKENKWTETWL